MKHTPEPEPEESVEEEQPAAEEPVAEPEPEPEPVDAPTPVAAQVEAGEPASKPKDVNEVAKEHGSEGKGEPVEEKAVETEEKVSSVHSVGRRDARAHLPFCRPRTRDRKATFSSTNRNRLKRRLLDMIISCIVSCRLYALCLTRHAVNGSAARRGSQLRLFTACDEG